MSKLDAYVQMNDLIFHKKGMEKELNFVKTDQIISENLMNYCLKICVFF